jgi:methyltransferase (TIGR00027 family)
MPTTAITSTWLKIGQSCDKGPRAGELPPFRQTDLGANICRVVCLIFFLASADPMRLPNFSNLMVVARLRYLQTIHESPDRRNPDSLVHRFIPLLGRWRGSRMGEEQLTKLRADPFYYYLVERTRHYDRVVGDAVSAGVTRIICVGCGTDTRAYRFKQVLRGNRIKVLECDLAAAIKAKRQVAARWRCGDFVRYQALDLNDGTWPAFESALKADPEAKTLVFMEGVSPYIDHRAFSRFLLLLASTLARGSLVAYDFKYRGANDEWGRGGRTEIPFRLARNSDEVATFHEDLGFQILRAEPSTDLCARMEARPLHAGSPYFDEDCLIRLLVSGWGLRSAPLEETERVAAFS